jgi:hypothetical protein
MVNLGKTRKISAHLRIDSRADRGEGVDVIKLNEHIKVPELDKINEVFNSNMKTIDGCGLCSGMGKLG